LIEAIPVLLLEASSVVGSVCTYFEIAAFSTSSSTFDHWPTFVTTILVAVVEIDWATAFWKGVTLVLQ
jgi:hypothetical protein